MAEKRMRRFSVCRLCLLVCLGGWPAVAAEFPAADVLLKSELELYGVAAGLTATEIAGASGGTAMALSDTALVAGALTLEPGQYTLLLRTWAPSGEQDGFFVDSNGVRTRRVADIGRWMTMALPFTVAKEDAFPLSIVGQEPGLIVDLLAVVRGTFKDNQLDASQLPHPMGPEQRVGVEALARLQFPCRLRELSQGPFADEVGTAYHQAFEATGAAGGGASGTTRTVPGKWGQALCVGVPDGRFDVDATRLTMLGPTGTIEWWVRPRPAQRLWHDQGWHYFLHCHPANTDNPAFDLSRHPLTQLQLTVACGEHAERLQLDTRKADLEEWHHLLVSWDFREERQYLWLLFDGKGVGGFFPRGFAAAAFTSIQFGNAPAGSGLPWLSMDGALDEIRISNTTVSERLVP